MSESHHCRRWSLRASCIDDECGLPGGGQVRMIHPTLSTHISAFVLLIFAAPKASGLVNQSAAHVQIRQLSFSCQDHSCLAALYLAP